MRGHTISEIVFFYQLNEIFKQKQTSFQSPGLPSVGSTLLSPPLASGQAGTSLSPALRLCPTQQSSLPFSPNSYYTYSLHHLH